ncbi:MAG TPA: sulfatase-like hydrolase/transferase [Thermoanaerobaculia bacterium]|jgi:arylsulfatase A-like enzyme/Tfp pilus assembly protein PilF|nr:sulfatase-like hydrolase/transferase [Thermoanaerobaculia bacterium]
MLRPYDYHPKTMRSRALLSLLVAVAAAAGCRSGPESAGAGPSRSGADVVLVTIDTLRADALGFAGNKRVETPTLDRLAAAGRVFDDAHAHNVVTLPSHTNILTGLYPYQHGVRDNSGFVLPARVPTLATLLKRAGYATGAFVAAYPLDSRYGLNQGFEVYDDSFPRGSDPAAFALAERRGDQVVAAARAWWGLQKGKHRFLWVHLYDPHAAYDPPEPFASRYRDNPYLGEVAAADSFLTPLLGPFLEHKEGPALVVVTADHGEALGDHGELTHGLFAYEPTLKVPLVVWGAGISPGRDNRPARHVDLVPTVLSYLGLKAPAELPGRSLLAAAGAEPDSYFESLSTSLNRGWAPLRGLLRERKKLIDLPLPELYDLAADPKEEKNLYTSERRTSRALRNALPRESVWPPPKGAVSPEEEARLRSLGYSAGAAEPKSVYTAADDPKSLIGVDRKLHQAVDAYSRGHYEEAAALARQAIAERPDLTEAYEDLALALRQLERHGEAIAALQSALQSGLDRESLRRQLGLALSEAGQAGEAVTVLQPLASSSNADPVTLNALAIALSDAGRHGEAVAVLQRAGGRYPKDPKAFENLGIVALRMDQPEQARAQLQRALALNSNLPISWNTLGVALYRLEGPAAALDAWERSVAIDPRQYDALFNIGLVAAQAGRPGQARQALTRFVATAPPARFGPDIQKARQILAQLAG